MLIWIIQSIILSVIFILILHNLICYFKDTLTIPKIKDLISSPSLKYENIYNIISTADSNPGAGAGANFNTPAAALNNSTSIFSKNDDDTISSMKNELKTFLKSQLQMNGGEKEPQTLESVSSYSAY